MFETYLPNFNILNFKNIDSEYLCHCGCNWSSNSVIYKIYDTKLPEDIVVTPNDETQYITASAKNRYLRSVTVKPVETTELTVTPSDEVQVFTNGPYGVVTVNASPE